MSKIYTVKMPDIGEGVVEGEIIEWLKQPNDLLKQDEPVVIVMTDKATVELPAPYPGKLHKQYYKAGQKAIKDQPLYDIEMEIEEKVTQPKPTQAIAKTETKMSTSETYKGLAAPPVRKLAKELEVDIKDVPGTGRQGLVTREDVVQHHVGSKKDEEVIPRFADDVEEPLIGIQALMAKRMTAAHDNIPHFSYFEQVDASRLVQLKHKFQEEGQKEGIGVTYMPFVIKALSKTLSQYPLVNSSLDMAKGILIKHQHHNIGIAMTTRLGLIVPVMKHVEKMSLEEIIRSFNHLKQKALEGKLASSDMKEGTISISNFGVLGGGGLWATPIINYPEVAILALARIQKQPVIKNDEMVIRDVLNLSWSFDHRVIDGDLAASFSHYFAGLLQNPAALI